MGLRGPGAKPLELRMLEGTASQVVSIPTAAIPAVKPDWLPPEALAIWDRTVASFPPLYFKACDEQHFAGYCMATHLWQTSVAELMRLQAASEKVPQSLLRQRAQAHAERMQLGDRLGIGPSKRTQSVAKSAQAKKSLMFKAGPNS